jgi:hypothetical protein
MLSIAICLTNEALGYEGVWGVDVYIHVFFTSALFGGGWTASITANFVPWKKSPSWQKDTSLRDP